MAVDVQVVFPQEVISLSSVRYLPGLTPLSLDITGQDFTAVDEVLINGVASPDIVVVSQKRLFAQVPASVLTSQLTSVTVISNRLAITERSLLRFRIGKTPSKVSGLLRLVQLFCKVLFTTPGKDIFAPRIGGAALKNIGATFGKDEGGSIVSDFIVSVATTQRQILAIQSRDPSIPRDERLLSAKVLKAGFNKAELALITQVEVTSQAGRSAVANVAL